MPHREFTDQDGTEWQVWDVRPTTTAKRVQLRADYLEGWLAFESSRGRRRLVPIPDGWESWPLERLCMACGEAAEQPARRRLLE